MRSVLLKILGDLPLLEDKKTTSGCPSARIKLSNSFLCGHGVAKGARILAAAVGEDLGQEGPTFTVTKEGA